MSNYKQQMENNAAMSWTRSTVADGRALNLSTIQKLNQNDQTLGKAIDDLNEKTEGTTDDLALKLSQEIIRAKDEEQKAFTAINNEVQRATEAEGDLQSQIDLMKSASDVVDVFNTDADFEAAKESMEEWITNNDIIKVLNGQWDESKIDPDKEPEQQYWKYLEDSNPKWNYFGNLNPYYSKSESDANYKPKQPVVNDPTALSTLTTTVLSNITQNENGVISATKKKIFPDYTKENINNVLTIDIKDEEPYLLWKELNNGSIIINWESSDSVKCRKLQTALDKNNNFINNVIIIDNEKGQMAFYNKKRFVSKDDYSQNVYIFKSNDFIYFIRFTYTAGGTSYFSNRNELNFTINRFVGGGYLEYFGLGMSYSRDCLDISQCKTYLEDQEVAGFCYPYEVETDFGQFSENDFKIDPRRNPLLVNSSLRDIYKQDSLSESPETTLDYSFTVTDNIINLHLNIPYIIFSGKKDELYIKLEHGWNASGSSWPTKSTWHDYQTDLSDSDNYKITDLSFKIGQPLIKLCSNKVWNKILQNYPKINNKTHCFTGIRSAVVFNDLWPYGTPFVKDGTTYNLNSLDDLYGYGSGGDRPISDIFNNPNFYNNMRKKYVGINMFSETSTATNPSMTTNFYLTSSYQPEPFYIKDNVLYSNFKLTMTKNNGYGGYKGNTSENAPIHICIGRIIIDTSWNLSDENNYPNLHFDNKIYSKDNLI